MKYWIAALVMALAALVPGFAAEGDAAPEPIFSNRLTNTFLPGNVADPGAVAKASLYSTADDGATWSLVQEFAVPEGAKELPRFSLTVAKDGKYGVMTCVTYHNGQSPDLPPRPGQAPGTVLYVDTAPPTLDRFDAQLTGTENGLARAAFLWSVADLHLDAEPAVIEASVDGGANFTVIHHGPAQGTATVSVPLPATTTSLIVRLSVTDLAGNVATTPPRSLSLTRAAAPANAMEELALAAKTLPTPAELGLAPPLPLPIWPVPSESVTETEAAPVVKPAPSTPVIAPKPAPPVWPALAEAPPPAPKPSAPVAKPAPVATAPAPSSAPAIAPKPAPPVWPTLAEVPPPAPKPSAPASRPVPAATATVSEVSVEPDRMPPVTAVAVSEPPSSVDEPPPRPQPAAKPKKPEKPAESRRIAVANPPVSPPPAPKPSAPRDGDRSPTLSQRFIGGASAQQRLQDARVSARLGRLDDACDIYEQLLSSDQSWIACAEEAALLNRLGRPRDALTVTNALPSDQLPDAARIEQGKALMTLKRHSEALGGLSRVNGNGPHGRMALLLIARCLMAEGKTEFSGKVLKRLSLGKDDIAAAARGELGMASR